MSQNLNVALTLSLQDRLTASHARAMTSIKQGYRSIHPEVERLSRLSSAASNNMAALGRNIDRTVSGLRSMARAVPAAMAAYQAGKFVLGDPVRQTQAYDLRLAQMANTAFTGRDTAGRRAGALQLDAAVTGAVRSGGGTRESAAETLDTLIASGTVGVDNAMKMLPTLQRFATASGADPSQLAAIAIRSMQSLNVAAEEMPRVLDMAITAGQAGGFELKDMARWLPQQMAASRLSGMTGMPGVAKLLAANQAAAITAGTKDEAGNNLVNLLAKINSQDTARDAAKLGINLSGSLAAARGKGVNSLDAFVNLVDQIASSDKNYGALRKKAAAAGDDGERRATYDSMADILQGGAIGKIVQDRQALMALVGIMNNREYMADVESKINAGSGAGERNFATIESTPAFQAQKLANEKAIGMQTALNQVNPLLGRMAEFLATQARDYPNLTAGIVAATTALMALAAAAGAAGVARFVMGGAGAAAGAAGTAGTAAAGATIGASAVALLSKARMGAALLMGAPSMAAIGSMGMGAMATAGAGVPAAGGVGYGLGTLLNEYLVTPLVEQFIGMRADQVAARAPQEIVVRVENGQITAELNRESTTQAKRH